jgi:hypothetical protein
MSKEERNSDTTLALAIILLMIGKWILGVLALIFQMINHAAWSLSGALGRFGKLIGPPLDLLATIATIIAVIWAIRRIYEYVQKITEFRSHLHEKVTDLKSELFKEIEEIKESLFEKSYAQDRQFYEFEQKTTALMESIEARLKAPTPIASSTHLEGAENTDSNALPR